LKEVPVFIATDITGERPSKKTGNARKNKKNYESHRTHSKTNSTIDGSNPNPKTIELTRTQKEHMTSTKLTHRRFLPRRTVLNPDSNPSPLKFRKQQPISAM
jgi:hypothetical protein